MSKKSVELDLLEEVVKCAKHTSTKHVRNLLVKSRLMEEDKVKISEFIIDETCSVIQVSKNQLFNGNLRGKRPLALAMCFRLHKDNLALSNKEIGEVFCKPENTVIKYLTMFSKLGTTLKFEAEILRKHGLINDKVKKLLNGKNS